jgi:hypothetical protein
MFEVQLTAPQIESDGMTVMFWYSDIEINAKSKIAARKKVEKMIKNQEIDYDILDEDGNEIDFQIPNDEVPDPEIDQVVKL